MTHTKALDFKILAEKAIAELTDYLASSEEGEGAVVDLKSWKEISDILELPHYIRKGGLRPEGIAGFLKNYLQLSMHMHHPKYLGHQVAIPHMGSMMGDLIHGVIANPMSIYEMGPSAATVELEMVRWMLEKTGWSDTGSGVFTHGGSLANIHAMLSARAAIAPDAWENGVPDDLVVLASENAHYSIARAIGIIGLGTAAIVGIPTDENEVIIPRTLERIIADQRAKGKRIMAIVANACATATGLHDPLREIGTIAQKENIWFHVDSPHGATALLSDKYKSYLDGLEIADSMVWDAHKMMQTGSLSTALLYRDKSKMQQTFRQKASYLFHEKENPGFDILPYQIECTKSGLATKLFLVMAMEGEEGMARYIDTVYDLAQQFHRMMLKRKGFSSPFPVESNIVCFQYLAGKLNQLKLREKLVATGEFYISSTEIRKTRYLRIVIMNPSSDAQILEGLLDHIEALGQKMLNGE